VRNIRRQCSGPEVLLTIANSPIAVFSDPVNPVLFPFIVWLPTAVLSLPVVFQNNELIREPHCTTTGVTPRAHYKSIVLLPLVLDSNAEARPQLSNNRSNWTSRFEIDQNIGISVVLDGRLVSKKCILDVHQFGLPSDY